MTIVFMLPVIDKPAGGHTILVEHVAILRQIGIDALICFEPLDGNSYYKATIAEEAVVKDPRVADRLLADPDVAIVIPESDLVRFAARLVTARQSDCRNLLILNQNHFYTFNFNDEASWIIFRGAKHIATSRSIATFLEQVTHKPSIPTIPVFINHLIFKPRTKIFQIAYMPRKMPDETEFVRKAFLEIAPDLHGVPWVAIDNMRPPDVAAVLNHSAIFMSLARREGFGMPALEAMASGCVVVGFTGMGGDEYAAADNGVWLACDDVTGLPISLVKVCRDMIEGASYLTTIISNAVQMAGRYNKQATMDAAKVAYSHFSDDFLERN
jgi:hypothetical protein